MKTPPMIPLTPEYRAAVRSRLDQLRFLAPSSVGSGLKVNEVTLTGRDDLDALDRLLAKDVPLLLAEVEQLSDEVAE